MNTSINCDTIVVGSGLAGLVVAYRLAKQGKQVLVLTKKRYKNSNSSEAQGGIAAAIAPDDSPAFHSEDTTMAGRGLCEKKAVDMLSGKASQSIQRLIDLGMQFDSDELGLEGGHGKRRIIHAGDATGRELVRFMGKLVEQEANIHIQENYFVTKLLTRDNRCYGVCAVDTTRLQQRVFYGRFVVLASGGCAGMFERTTNPPVSTGDGVALAYDEGATVMDMEFIQFHPTALFLSNEKSFLISEAVRGEGAYLLNSKGERFMLPLDPQAELAPRDVVAHAIYEEIKKDKATHVFLSLNHLNTERIQKRFHTINSRLLSFGLDMAKDAIPIAPAAHYMVGGVKTDLDGKTSIQNLYACGETAASGVMGANRLASNSLLECLVFGDNVADHILAQSELSFSIPDLPIPQYRFSFRSHKAYKRMKLDLSFLMSQQVGIVRRQVTLKRALSTINYWYENSVDENDYYSVKARLLLTTAFLIARGALKREESRGAQIRSDYPKEASSPYHILQEKGKKMQYLDINK